MRTYVVAVALISVVIVCGGCPTQQVAFVNKDATGTADGKTWNTAWRTIGDALSHSIANGSIVKPVWVKQGTYNETITIPTNYTVYGGFKGTEAWGDADCYTGRNLAEGATKIVGTSTTGPVVTIGGGSTALDGFTVTGGNNTTGEGGGLYMNTVADVVITNSFFTGNKANGSGGAIFMGGSRATITFCAFKNNVSETRFVSGITYGGYGGAVAVSGCQDTTNQLTMSDCTFLNNHAACQGGGLYFTSTQCYWAVNTVTRCQFDKNVAGLGGALVTDWTGPVNIRNCRFAENYAWHYGGAMYIESSLASPEVFNCTFEANKAEEQGGAIYGGADSGPNIRSCSFYNNIIVDATAANSATMGRSIAFISTWEEMTAPTIMNCILWSDDGLEGAEYYSERGFGASIISYSNVKCTGGTVIYDGAHNINRDPMFCLAHRPTPATLLTSLNRLDLTLGSPCIDSGRNDIFEAGDGLDFDILYDPLDTVHPRWRGVDGDGIDSMTIGDGSDFDMGAYEYVPKESFWIRIGDVDGFGWGNGTALTAGNVFSANPKPDSSGYWPVKVTGDTGPLGPLDFLPDFDQRDVDPAAGIERRATCWNDWIACPGSDPSWNPAPRPYWSDDWDNRSPDEMTSHYVEQLGCTNYTATEGSKWTDITLSRSYEATMGKYNGTIPPLFTKPLGAFPCTFTCDQSRQPSPENGGYTFDFDVAKENIDSWQPVYFNLVFGDYDVGTIEVLLVTRDHLGADGTPIAAKEYSVPLTAQPPSMDGLIQAAFLNVNMGQSVDPNAIYFEDIFEDHGDTYHGHLTVFFDDGLNGTQFEPYTAFDYVELSTTPIAIVVPSCGDINDMLAQAHNGDLIVVPPCDDPYPPVVWPGSVDAPLNVTLTSMNPDDETTVAHTRITGNSMTPAITMVGSEWGSCTINGFTIEEGYALNRDGGGICGQGSAAQVIKCVVHGCEAEGTGIGGGIARMGVVDTTTVYSCCAPNGGGVASCMILRNSRIDSCSAQNGGGAYDCDNVVLDLFDSCVASDVGGGAYQCGNLVQSTFISCTALRGGGAHSCTNVTQSTFEQNGADQGGGLYNCAPITMNWIASNRAKYQGAGIYADFSGPGSLQMINNFISWNYLTGGSSYTRGVGAYIWSATPRVIYNTFVNNGDVAGGSSLWTQETGPIQNCIFAGNRGDAQRATCYVTANVGDVQFVDQGEPDYHIKATSPARNIGVAISDITTDCDGQTRSNPSDAGADEYYPN